VNAINRVSVLSVFVRFNVTLNFLAATYNCTRYSTSVSTTKIVIDSSKFYMSVAVTSNTRLDEDFDGVIISARGRIIFYDHRKLVQRLICNDPIINT